MRKVALGALLALVFAAFPIGAQQAGAQAPAVVHAIYTSQANLVGELCTNGALGVPACQHISPDQAIDLNFDPGSYTVRVCEAGTTALDTFALCNSGEPGGLAGDNFDVSNITGGNNYTLALTNITGPLPDPPGVIKDWEIFENNLTPTANEATRFTLNNAIFNPAGPSPDADVCIDGNKILVDVVAGETKSIEIPSEQGALLAVAVPGGPCPSGSPINLVAGTNFVLTLTDSATCTGACVQVLFVGQVQTEAHEVDVTQFCAQVIGLGSFQVQFKLILAPVDPTSTATIFATQPSPASLQAFVEKTQQTIAEGDESVPNTIKPQWVIATAGIRVLLQTFTLVGYDLSALPQPVVQEIVESSQGQVIPGIPVNEDVQGAGDALRFFFTTFCVAATPTPAPTPAPTPTQTVVAQPKFTG